MKEDTVFELELINKSIKEKHSLLSFFHLIVTCIVLDGEKGLIQQFNTFPFSCGAKTKALSLYRPAFLLN